MKPLCASSPLQAPKTRFFEWENHFLTVEYITRSMVTDTCWIYLDKNNLSWAEIPPSNPRKKMKKYWTFTGNFVCGLLSQPLASSAWHDNPSNLLFWCHAFYLSCLFLFPSDFSEDKSIFCTMQGENECTITFRMTPDEEGKKVIYNISQNGRHLILSVRDFNVRRGKCDKWFPPNKIVGKHNTSI